LIFNSCGELPLLRKKDGCINNWSTGEFSLYFKIDLNPADK